jgi:hypothetical protein
VHVAAKYLPHFPKPVLDDLVTGKWLPVIGAGMSMNAVVPAGKKMPLWAAMGEAPAEVSGTWPYLLVLIRSSRSGGGFGRLWTCNRDLSRQRDYLWPNQVCAHFAHTCTTSGAFLFC